MKKKIFAISMIALIAISACNSGDNSSKDNDMSKMNSDTANSATSNNTQITEISPGFSNVDPNLNASLKTVIDHYLHIKNALANDNGSEAASGGKAMTEAMSKVDKSLFTAEQKKVYDEIEDDMKEHAEHISTNAGNIEHQREHFAMMSEDAYDLTKAFGAGREMYHDHCPMYNKDKGGSMWLSETKEIKNPYMGSKMSTCGTVQEKIKG